MGSTVVFILSAIGRLSLVAVFFVAVVYCASQIGIIATALMVFVGVPVAIVFVLMWAVIFRTMMED